MKWYYNLKIAIKLYIGFGINLLLLVGAAILTYVSLESVRSAQEEAFKGRDLSEFLKEKWSDHLTFVKNLDESIMLGKEFGGQLDPTQCAFGKWYGTFTPASDEMKQAYESINRPHRLLHEYAAQIRALQKKRATQFAQTTIYATKIMPVLGEVDQGIRNLAGVVTKSTVTETHRSEEAIRSVSTSVLILMIVSSILASIISLFISRVISRPIREVIANIESADLNSKFNSARADEIGDLQRSFDGFTASIRSTLLQVTEASSAVSSASTQISSSTEEMAAGTQEQTSQAGEVASAVEEMTKTIVENSKNAAETTETAKRAKKAAEEGVHVSQETTQAIGRIVENANSVGEIVNNLGISSRKIGDIISVIDDIADQTNLLALNAAIEAARAGDNGRGFAVVADEVRKLAERTTKATKEIYELIKTIQANTGNAVKSMEVAKTVVSEGMHMTKKTGTALEEIVRMTNEVTDMTTQIAAASEQQSSASEQISKNIEAISAVTQQTATGTQQIARAAEDLNRLTENLQGLVSKFKLIDGITQKFHTPPISPKGEKKSPTSSNSSKLSFAVQEHGSLAEVG